MIRNLNLRKLLVLASVLGLVTLSITACSPQPADNNQEQNVSEDEPKAEALPVEPVAVLIEFTGSVTVQNADGEFIAAVEGQELFAEDQVKTGQDGRVRIDFPDETIVRLGPSSLFSLGETVETDDGALKKLILSFGQVWVVLTGGQLDVDTNAGVASVRGSYLSVWQDEDTGELYLTCLEGTCGFEFGDEEIIIGNLETIRVAGFGEAPTLGVMSEEEVEAWLASNPEAYLILDLVHSSVGGRAWFDDNGDGLQDEEEPGIEGVEVALMSPTGEELATTVTDEDGNYAFEELLLGEYQLSFAQPDNLLFTLTDEGTDDEVDSDPDETGLVPVFTLVPGEHNLSMDAGYVQPGGGAVCPLTGLPIEDESLLALRPIFISISIFPEFVRPVTGINSAPVVFETLIDEGQTRLQALFYCGYPTVLPDSDGGSSTSSAGFDISGVRSGRVFYAELAQLFGAGLIFGGADPTVFNQIAPFTCSLANTSNQSDIGAGGVDVDRLVGIAESCQSDLGNTDLTVWQFGDAPDGGMAVDKFLMVYNHYNQSRWIYDPEAGGYVRYQNRTSDPEEFVLATDRLTGEAVVRQNILILKVSHQVMNSSGTIINFDLTDERGYAVLLRNGTAYNVCWSAVNNDYEYRSNRYRPFLIYDCETGEQVNLAYGGLWVNVVDYSVGFSWQGEYWRAYQPYLSYSP
jgi:hypothetical protein